MCPPAHPGSHEEEKIGMDDVDEMLEAEGEAGGEELPFCFEVLLSAGFRRRFEIAVRWTLLIYPMQFLLQHSHDQKCPCCRPP